MEKQIKKTNDKQAELSNQKQPYKAARLKKLGTVKDLTLGGTITQVTWDDGAAYYSS